MIRAYRNDVLELLVEDRDGSEELVHVYLPAFEEHDTDQPDWP